MMNNNNNNDNIINLLIIYYRYLRNYIPNLYASYVYQKTVFDRRMQIVDWNKRNLPQ